MKPPVPVKKSGVYLLEGLKKPKKKLINSLGKGIFTASKYE